MDLTITLPGECISDIISLTTPRDACRLTVLCPAFKSLAESGYVWEKFLPSDYEEIITNSVSASSSLLTSMSKKDLYFHLCNNPILINNGTMSFALERESGKKCLMVGARGLSITWGSSPGYWKWISRPESRFPEVAKLRHVWWFEIIGSIETRILSSKTRYAAYFVFKFEGTRRYGFDKRPVEFRVYFEGSDDNGETRKALLDPPENKPQDRGDGWMEIEMGEFFNENGDDDDDDGTLVCTAFKFEGVPKRGIVIQGIELRPRKG